jgi:hypothetical protein
MIGSSKLANIVSLVSLNYLLAKVPTLIPLLDAM